MNWWVSVFMRESDMQALQAGDKYCSGPDGLFLVAGVLRKLGIVPPPQWTCATVTNGSANHPAAPFGAVEARLNFNAIFPSIMVITERDLQDTCNRVNRTGRCLSRRDQRMFFVPVSFAETQAHLSDLSSPNGQVYPEVRIGRAICIDDVLGFYSRQGQPLAETPGE